MGSQSVDDLQRKYNETVAGMNQTYAQQQQENRENFNRNTSDMSENFEEARDSMYSSYAIAVGCIFILFIILAVAAYYYTQRKNAEDDEDREAEFETLALPFQQVLQDPAASPEAKRDAAAQIAKIKLELRQQGIQAKAMHYGHGYHGYHGFHT